MDAWCEEIRGRLRTFVRYDLAGTVYHISAKRCTEAGIMMTSYDFGCRDFRVFHAYMRIQKRAVR